MLYGGFPVVVKSLILVDMGLLHVEGEKPFDILTHFIFIFHSQYSYHDKFFILIFFVLDYTNIFIICLSYYPTLALKLLISQS